MRCDMEAIVGFRFNRIVHIERYATSDPRRLRSRPSRERAEGADRSDDPSSFRLC